jgi:hypothetical protein
LSKGFGSVYLPYALAKKYKNADMEFAWQYVFPAKTISIDFMFDRSLLTKLSRCAWKVLNLCLTQAVAYDDAKAGAAVACRALATFKIFILIYMFWPPMAVSTTMPPSWSAQRLIPVRLKSCFAMKFSRCSKPKAKSLML